MMLKLNTTDKFSYYYSIYGLNIKSNTMISMAEVTTFNEDIDIFIELSYSETLCLGSHDKAELVHDGNDTYSFFIPDVAVYFIKSNSIVCIAKDYKSFISTLFNIPFSVLLLLRGEILVHACALLSEKGLILLSGDKGVGKSTISAILSKSNEFDFYADDTVRIDKNHIGYNAHYYQKLSLLTMSKLGIQEHNDRDLSGKFYIKHIPQRIVGRFSKVHTLISISRGKELRISKREIGNYIKRSIVGIEFMPIQLLHRLVKMKIDFEEVYQLILPNSIDILISKKDEIKNIIREV